MTPIIAETAQPRYVNLLADMASGAKELVAAHAEQLHEEVKADAGRATSAMSLFAAAGSLMGIGFAFTLFTIVHLLRDRYGLSDTFAWALTAGSTLVAGVIVLIIARLQLSTVRLLPVHTLHSIQESLSCITRR